MPTPLAGLQSLFYASTGEKGIELYRVLLDQTNRLVGSPYRADTPELWRSRMLFEGLHASPDGRHMAMSWVYGEGGTYVWILHMEDGTITPLFGDKVQTDKRAVFLDWSPNGDEILVLGGIGSVDLGGRAWLVNIHTGERAPTGIAFDKNEPSLMSAAFSPDGQTIVYARPRCYQCGSEVWQIALGQGEPQLLFKEEPDFRIEDMLWSPDGRYIAFTRWRESTTPSFGAGELWVIEVEGGAKRPLSAVTTGHYYGLWDAAWSPDGEGIAFVLGEDAPSATQVSDWSGNVYVVDVVSGTIAQLTHFQDRQILGPTWSPDGSMLAFAVAQDAAPDRFEPWVVSADGQGLRRLDEGGTVIMDTRHSSPAIAWLPALPQEVGR